LRHRAEEEAKGGKKTAWDMFQTPIKVERDALVRIIEERKCRCAESVKEDAVENIVADLKKVLTPIQER
jgi:hypothetical protein